MLEIEAKKAKRDQQIEQLHKIGKKEVIPAQPEKIKQLEGEEKEQDIKSTMSMIEETLKMGVFAHSISPLILFPQTQLSKDAKKYGITKHFNNFEDFKKFSNTPRNIDGIYPELITHEIIYQPKELTLAYLKKIKEFIIKTEKEITGLNRKRNNIRTDYLKFREAEIF